MGALTGALSLALVGVMHVHHAPSHDSDASFEDVAAAAHSAELDFVVLTDHVGERTRGALPGAERAGLHVDESGHRLLVLIGAELGTADGHLLALDVPELVPALDRRGRDVIADIHGLGGFAVVPHPLSYGGWRDLSAPFDGIEVHNHASELRAELGPLLPLRLLHFAFDPDAAFAALLDRPAEMLELWERLLQRGRRVVAFSGVDAHQNLRIAGWQLDPYERVFGAVQTVCPDTPLAAEAVWSALRGGECALRWSIHADREAEAVEVRFPSGRIELQFGAGSSVLEVRQPPELRQLRQRPTAR